MKKIVAPINLQEQSENVGNLHRAMEIFGLNVPADEKDRKFAGDTTLRLIRTLQRQFNLQIDDHVLVDEQTAERLNDFLRERGLLEEDGPKRFRVSGRVFNETGLPLSRKKIVAFDVDLRGASIYETVKNFHALHENKGFEELGSAETNSDGYYEIFFQGNKFAKAENELADIVAYLAEGEGIAGRSTLATKKSYSNGWEVRNLHVFATTKVRLVKAEYILIMEAIGEQLSQNELRLLQLEPAQVKFLAIETTQAEEKIALLVKADQLLHEQRQGIRGLSHELLYGLGRHELLLSWTAFAMSTEKTLMELLTRSIDANIISFFEEGVLRTFVKQLQEIATIQLLDEVQANGQSMSAQLALALADRDTQVNFIIAYRNYSGSPEKFWKEFLPQQPGFTDKPELISSLQLTNQLVLLTANHFPLIKELQQARGIKNVQELLKLSRNEWREIVERTGIPGEANDDNKEQYIDVIGAVLHAAYPTEKISLMVNRNELNYDDHTVKSGLVSFFDTAKNFDFSVSRVDDFNDEIQTVANGKHVAVKSELKTLQRLFQVSPTPDVMAKLHSAGFTSARQISSIPEQSFVRMYGGELGEDNVAAVYSKASFHTSQSESVGMMLYEMSNSMSMGMGFTTYDPLVPQLQGVIKKHIPNYEELFGKTDVCECEHCRSVYSASAYYVDILRFLEKSAQNANGKSPKDMMLLRRPDLVHIPLTCENTNTLIPYIDLVNEILEFYTVHNKLDKHAAHDTGDTSSEELRANPQYTMIEAYKILKDAVFPFTLPYHQPLDTIRAYLKHLGTTRHDVMKSFRNDILPATTMAIHAENLELSPEEYQVLTAKDFSDNPVTRDLWEYYGYLTANAFHASIFQVPALLQQTGIAYTDLVEMIKTQFINPHQFKLDYLQDMFDDSGLTPLELYSKLKLISGGALDPAVDIDLMKVLNPKKISSDQFSQWVTKNFQGFQDVITLYEPQSKCDLANTRLRSLKSIYESLPGPDIGDATLSSMHRFIRLWRKTGWTIRDLDNAIVSLGESDINSSLLIKVSFVKTINAQLKLELRQLFTLWGKIETYGKKSLYAKLFLNKAVQKIDEVFVADKFGNYLDSGSILIKDHVPAVLAAFRLNDEGFGIILKDSAIDIANAKLSHENLAIIYRYVVLSKALKITVGDLCLLKQIFGTNPFSQWDNAANKFKDIDPQVTLEFCELVQQFKASGFKIQELNYILKGTSSPDANVAIPEDKVRQTIRLIREGLKKVELDHPDADTNPVTEESLRAKIQIIFSSEVTEQFFAIINGAAVYQAFADSNLGIVIPQNLSSKVTYQKGSGRVQYTGVINDADKAGLENLAGATQRFKDAIQSIYDQPGQFIKDNFSGVFNGSVTDALKKLLDHPSQASILSVPEKFSFFYTAFLPFLKKQLKKNIVVQHVSTLTGLDEPTMNLLLESTIEQIVKTLSETGFTGTYFKDIGFSLFGLKRVDPVIDFTWNGNAPDPIISADEFSVRWEGWICPAQSDNYTLIADVQQADESVKVWVDDQLAFEKNAGNPMLSMEAIMNLTAGRMHKVKLEYAENISDAGIRFSWQSATLPKVIIPTEVSFPDAAIKSFTELASKFHRAALFINGFKLNVAEVQHLQHFAADFSNIDLLSLTEAHWLRIASYVMLRNDLPKAMYPIIDVFHEANKSTPIPALDAIIEVMVLATGWNKTYLDFLVKTQFQFSVNELRNEIALSRIHSAMKLARKTEAAVESLANWGAVVNQFMQLDEIAQDIKNTVKAKYEEADWLDVSKGLSDKIRENQTKALIAYLLQDKDLKDWGVSDANGLYEYFLIDVQMTAAMDSSRIVQAISSVQMFVARILLNLESERNNSNNEIGVDPGAIDTHRWEWMKNYRVWEANRKVFLYPENWLEPEWRDDKSYFFKELEGELLQNDITDASVETAFRNYLFKLNEVSNMHVCGMYQDMETMTLHVFARTHTEPYNYYYRSRNKYKHWKPWEKITVDIKAVKANSGLTDRSGVHLIPLTWKKRLFLFWPEFSEKTVSSEKNSGETAENAAKQTSVSDLKATKYWEISLAWTEYKEGKWSPKQVSKEVVIPGKKIQLKDWVYYDAHQKEFFEDFVKRYRFDAYIDSNNRLNVRVMHENHDDHGRFILPDVQSKVSTDYKYTSWGGAVNYLSFPENVEGFAAKFTNLGIAVAVGSSDLITMVVPSKYQTNYMAFELNDTLQLKGNTYFKKQVEHNLLYSHPISTSYFESTVAYPFFYYDNNRTYFITPEDISYLVPGVKSPGNQPFFPFDMIKDFTLVEKFPQKPPKVGPEDLIPNENLMEDILVTTFNSNSIASHAANVPRSGTIPMSGSFDPSSSKSISYSSSMKSSYMTKPSFAGLGVYESNIGKINWETKSDKGLRVFPFFHPYSSAFITRLNEDGIGGLQEADTTFNDDKGAHFKLNYDPNMSKGLVQSPLPAINVDFDEYGAYSGYNWELFFHAPLFIATRLSKNGKYAEAMKWFHYIFDPTTNEVPNASNPNARYWKVLPFKTIPTQNLEDYLKNLSTNDNPAEKTKLINLINEWKDNPFKPHLIARGRPIAYMKNVVVKYIENLMSWADDLFRRDTMESINEAIQLYVIVAHLLKNRPQFVPKRGTMKAETYFSLQPKLDEFSNALVQLENIFPYSSELMVSGKSTPANLLGMGPSLYFCIPNNEKILKCWDAVEDRLFKIRHSMNIEGVERKLALFAPPIDPAMLVQAAAKGLSIGSVLADLNSPAPFYRFHHLLQKAFDFCTEVKTLGTALLSALEKRDAEDLARKRAYHESKMLGMIKEYKQKQVLEAKANKQAIEKTREATVKKLQYYLDLLGKTDFSIPAMAAALSPESNEETMLPDTTLQDIKADVDNGLVDVSERGLKIISKEKNELDQLETAFDFQQAANVAQGSAALMSMIPTFSIDGKFLGIGAGVSFGGPNLAGAANAAASGFSFVSNIHTYRSDKSAKLANYIRREQEWTTAANLAARELPNLDKQLLAADIRVQLAQKDLDNHKQQIENSAEVELFLQDKFTNTELYQWMRDQLFSVYKQSYQLAYDMAKKAEKAFRFEIGKSDTNFIQFGYWDSSYQGLTAGEKLDLSLREMEKNYLDSNRREFELTKHISIANLNPYALLKLKGTGSCEIELPEEIFDLDYPGHYFRRIKSVSVSIPCIAGAFTTINCTLRLLKNSIRLNTTNGSNGYEHNNDDGMPVDDERFVENNIPFKVIATSSGQNDNGVFELNFRDDRYLPFEGAGAISTWKLECNGKFIVDGTLVDLSQFAFDSISDIILHIKYTSREDAGKFRQDAVRHLNDYITKAIDNAPEPFVRMFSLRYDFPDAYHKLMHPKDGEPQSIELVIGKNHFNRFFAMRNLNTVETVIVLQPKEGKTITTPGSFTIDNTNAGSWVSVFNTEMKKTTIALGEYDPVKKVSLKAAGVQPADPGLKAEEIDDVLILMYFRVGV